MSGPAQPVAAEHAPSPGLVQAAGYHIERDQEKSTGGVGRPVTHLLPTHVSPGRCAAARTASLEGCMVPSQTRQSRAPYLEAVYRGKTRGKTEWFSPRSSHSVRACSTQCTQLSFRRSRKCRDPETTIVTELAPCSTKSTHISAAELPEPITATLLPANRAPLP